MLTRPILGVACLLLSVSVSAVDRVQIDDFEDGTTLDWRESDRGGVNSPNPPTNVSDGGPFGAGDNYLTNDSSGGAGAGSRMVMFNTDQWSGDYVAQGITSITAKVRNSGGTSLNLRIALESGGAQYASVNAVSLPPGSGWVAVTFGLEAADMTQVFGTAFDLQQALADVDEFRILSSAIPAWRGDSLIGTLDVDIITAVPLFDLTDLADVSSDAVPDFAYLERVGNDSGVDIFSGANGNPVDTINFFGATWELVAISTLIDADGDGVANDPALAVLANRISDNKHVVETRHVDTGGKVVSNITFLDSSFKAIDVAVINDTNGDGVPDDPSLAVLGVDPLTLVGRVQVRLLSDGSQVKRLGVFFDPNWRPIAVEALTRGGLAEVHVLAVNQVNNRNRVQSRRVISGAKLPNIGFLGSVWEGQDIAVLQDADGNGVANDPALLVLGVNRLSGRNRIQSKLISSRALLKNIALVSETSQSWSIAASADISGNQIEEVAGVTVRRGSGTIVIKVRDYATEAVTLNINP